MTSRKLVALVAAAGLLIALAAAGVLAAVAGRDGDSPHYRGSTPPAGVRLADFELRSYTGRTVRSADLAGKVVVITFLETKCREACPIIADEIARAVDRLAPETRSRSAFIAISVHPTDDTPRSVRAFLRTHNALGKLDYLIGSEATLRPVWKHFGVLSAVDSGDADTHSASVRIFDSAGFQVSSLHAGVDLSPQNLDHDVSVALENGGTQ
jgi:protein SCO1